MPSLMARAAATSGLLMLMAACGGGGTVVAGGSTTSAGPAGPTVPSAPSTTATRPPTTPGPPQTPKTGPLTTPPTARPTDPYLPPGVPDQVNPPGTNASKLLSAGQCGPLLRQIRGPITAAEAPTTVSWIEGKVPEDLTNLYVAAGEACLANWKVARAAFSKVSTAELCKVDGSGKLVEVGAVFASPAECRKTREGVYLWTENLLKASAANPAFVPNFRPPPKR